MKQVKIETLINQKNRQVLVLKEKINKLEIEIKDLEVLNKKEKKLIEDKRKFEEEISKYFNTKRSKNVKEEIKNTEMNKMISEEKDDDNYNDLNTKLDEYLSNK